MNIIKSASTAKKRECMNAYIKRKNLEYDKKIANTPEVKHRDDKLSLIINERELLRTFCPNFDITVFRTVKKKSRKKRVCRSWTTRDIVEPKMIYDEDVWINKMVDPRVFRNKKIKCYVVNDPLADPLFKDIVRKPKCFKCLHEDVKCKYRGSLLSVLDHKTRDTRFKRMLLRVMGPVWFNNSVT